MIDLPCQLKSAFFFDITSIQNSSCVPQRPDSYVGNKRNEAIFVELEKRKNEHKLAEEIFHKCIFRCFCLIKVFHKNMLDEKKVKDDDKKRLVCRG